MRGQLLVAACLGVLYAVGFSAIGIDLAIGVGLLAGAMAVIPYLGSIVALGTATVLCVLKFGFDGHLLAVVGWYAVVQNLEGFVLTPRIVGSSVGLHPAAVIVALLIGGDLLRVPWTVDRRSGGGGREGVRRRGAARVPQLVAVWGETAVAAAASMENEGPAPPS